MLAEEKELRSNYQHYFLRKYRYLYWLVVVNNHFDDIYSIFLYTRKQHTQLTRSYELVHFKRDPALYKQVMRALKQMSKLRIEMRDTRHLVHPGTDITHDTVHGHHG